MELNREQVVKALECCGNYAGYCNDFCPLRHDDECTNHLAQAALSLIREQAEENERLSRTRYMVTPDGRLEMIPSVESVKADTLNDVQMRFAMHFGTYTGDAEVKVSDVFKLLSKFKEEMLEGEI